MSKVRPNDPCPCGSGRKHKRCCGDPSKPRTVGTAGVSEVNPATAREEPVVGADNDETEHAGTGPDEPYEWPPLDRARLPRRILTTDEMRILFGPKHRRLTGRLADLVRDGSVQASHEGLRLLEVIPDDQLQALWALPEMKVQLLMRVGDWELAWTEMLRFMAARCAESSWLEFAELFAKRFQACEDRDTRLRTVEELRAVVARCPNATPRLALGIALVPLEEDGLTDETLKLLQDALQAPGWEQNVKLLPPWRNAVAYGFAVVIEALLLRESPQEARAMAHRAASLPWAGKAPLIEITIGRLLCAMFTAGAEEEASRIGREILRRHPNTPLVSFWLGVVASKRGDDARASRYMHHARQSSSLREIDLLWMTAFFLRHKEWQAALDTVRRIDNRQSAQALYYEARALLELGQPQEAAEKAALSWERAPGDRRAYLVRYEALRRGDRDDELERWLREIVADPEARLQVDARLALAKLLLKRQDAKAALEMVAEWTSGPMPVSEPVSLAAMHSVVGSVLEANDRHEEAAVHYERAARLDPSDNRSARLAHALIAADRDEEAEREVAVGLQAWPGSKLLLLAGVLSADASGNSEQVLERIAALGDPWTVEPALGEALVFAEVRALVQLDRPMDALMCFEEHLEATLADDELRSLREAVVKDVEQRFAQLEKAVEREKRRLRSHREDTMRAIADLRRGADRKRDEIGRLLRERGESRTAPAAAEDGAWEAPPLGGLSSGNQRSLIESAERLWSALAARPEDDHGAVVIQLARAVEALVNGRLVDRLAGLCIERHGNLSAIQAVTTAAVRAVNNRLSLGEAATVLWAEREEIGRDGSVSLVRNPRSSDAHREIVDRLWESVMAGSVAGEDQRYLRNGLSVDLVDLARMRNAAGHAGMPLARDVAARARQLVLGDAERPGIVPRIARCLVVAS